MAYMTEKITPNFRAGPRDGKTVTGQLTLENWEIEPKKDHSVTKKVKEMKSIRCRVSTELFCSTLHGRKETISRIEMFA